MRFSVFRPENLAQIQGGLVWLSGLSCTEENFITKAGSQRFLSELNMVLICPDTSPRGLNLPGEHDSYDFGSGAGFYVDALTGSYKDHYKMYSYVNDEIYSLFDSKFNLKGNISISGHSMGGHGALVLGLRNPIKYKSVSAFSPIVNPTRCAWGQKAFQGYLGEDKSLWNSYDACELLLKGCTHPQEILIDQGLADEFLDKNQLLPQNFEKAALKAEQKLILEYQEAYDHSYYFISTFIEKHIRFHAQKLNIRSNIKL
jgi:S-formylglutathione hydrolase